MSTSRGAKRSTPFISDCPEIVRKTMEEFASLTGRQYDLFEYVGDPDAERVIVMMGSGAETVRGDGRKSERPAARKSA